MNGSHRIAILASLALAASAFGAGTATADPTVIRIGSTVPAASSSARLVAKPWVAKMQKDSHGTLKFEEFFGGSLVRSHRKQYEGLINGLQDAATVVTSYTEKLFPDFSLFSLPLMFRGTGCEEAAYVAWKLYEKGMIGGLDKVHVVATFTNDNSGLHFNTPIKKIADIKGMKVRTAGPGEAEVIEIMGATPVAIAITQVAESLHRGVIQGTLNGWSALNTFRITSLIKSDVDMPFGVRSFFIAFNKKVYDGLPAAAKKAIDDNGGLGLSQRYGQFWAHEGQATRDKLAKEHTVIRPSEEELQKVWFPKFRHIQENWIAQDKAHRQKLFDEAQKLIAEYRKSGGA